jgi:hypothetical protein
VTVTVNFSSAAVSRLCWVWKTMIFPPTSGN